MSVMVDTGPALSIAEQAFESDIFGAPVWRLTVAPDERVKKSSIEEMVNHARSEGVALIACRLPERSPARYSLRDSGFRKVERLVTLYRPLPVEMEMPDGVEIGSGDDTAAAVEVGRTVFNFDRYHADPEIPKDIADAIKADWVRNGMNGRADAPFVARVDGKLAGFNLCMRHGDDAVIDLIGVADGYQGRGIGASLVTGAIVHYSGRARRMRVGTQENNTVSLAMYRRAGFEPHDVAETWHWTK